MLMLGRKKGESIIINNEIEIKIVDIQVGGLVRVGIDAPKEIPVHRKEIQDKINRQKKEGIKDENTEDKES